MLAIRAATRARRAGCPRRCATRASGASGRTCMPQALRRLTSAALERALAARRAHRPHRQGPRPAATSGTNCAPSASRWRGGDARGCRLPNRGRIAAFSREESWTSSPTCTASAGRRARPRARWRGPTPRAKNTRARWRWRQPSNATARACWRPTRRTWTDAKGKGLEPALVDRLTLTPKGVRDMAEGLREIAQLPDPVGEITELAYRPSGIQVGRMRVPLGVDRHHLRVAAERDRRRRRPVPEVRQRRDPARRLRGDPLQPGHRRLRARRA